LLDETPHHIEVKATRGSNQRAVLHVRE
jgi:hypothetical protein